jgi:hypothetical protein
MGEEVFCGKARAADRMFQHPGKGRTTPRAERDRAADRSGFSAPARVGCVEVESPKTLNPALNKGGTVLRGHV